MSSFIVACPGLSFRGLGCSWPRPAPRFFFFSFCGVGPSLVGDDPGKALRSKLNQQSREALFLFLFLLTAGNVVQSQSWGHLRGDFGNGNMYGAR